MLTRLAAWFKIHNNHTYTVSKKRHWCSTL